MKSWFALLVVTGDVTLRYSGEITKKLWRSLNNKVSQAHFLLSCRESHLSDDNIKVYAISKISSPGATKYKASRSLLDRFNFVNIAEMVGVINCGTIWLCRSVGNHSSLGGPRALIRRIDLYGNNSIPMEKLYNLWGPWPPWPPRFLYLCDYDYDYEYDYIILVKSKTGSYKTKSLQ